MLGGRRGFLIGLACRTFVGNKTVTLVAVLTLAHDRRTFVAAPGIMLTVAMVACALPARQAMQLDPAATARVEYAGRL